MYFSTSNLFLIEFVDRGKKSSEMQLIRVPVAHGLPAVQPVCGDRWKWAEYLGFLKAAGERADRGHRVWTPVPDKSVNNANKTRKVQISGIIQVSIRSSVQVKEVTNTVARMPA